MNTPARDWTIACIALVLGWSGPSALAATASFTTDIGTKSVKCDVMVSDDVHPVRGMVIVYAWGGSVEAARALVVGIISVAANSAADWREGNARQAQAMLDAAAEAVKRPEIRTAPLMMVGSSWGGFMAVELMTRGGCGGDPADQSLADRDQPHGVAARSGAGDFHAP